MLSSKNPNAVLVKFPVGKKYLRNSTVFNQASNAEKGICWFYTFNNLRPRYGKLFPDTHPKRRIEKIISLYSKNFSKIEDEYSLYMQTIKSLHENYKVTKITNSYFKDMVDYFKLNNLKITKHGIDLTNVIYTLYNDFINQTKYEFLEDFVEYKYLKSNIENCETTLKQLGHNPQKKLSDFISDNGLQENKLTESDKKSFLKTIVMLEASKSFNLKTSSWHPLYGVEALIDELNKYGALEVGAVLSIYCYNKPAHKLKDRFFGHEIFGWKPGEYVESMQAHSILIVGAQKIAEQEYVYFLDPLDENNKDSPRKIYKISFERLFKCIIPMSGLQISDQNSILNLRNTKGPFAVYANQVELNDLYEFHKFYKLDEFQQDLANFLKTDTIEEAIKAEKEIKLELKKEKCVNKNNSITIGSPITTYGDLHNEMLSILNSKFNSNKQYNLFFEYLNSKRYSNALREIACCNNFDDALQIIKIMFRYKALNFDINERDVNGRTALHLAAIAGNVELLTIFKLEDGDHKIKDKNNKSPDDYMCEFIKLSLKN